MRQKSRPEKQPANDAILSKAVAGTGIPATLGPYMVAMLVFGIGLSLGGPTGFAVNSARDLGARIAHAVLPIPGKGGSDWAYSWVPVVGPLAGGRSRQFSSRRSSKLPCKEAPRPSQRLTLLSPLKSSKANTPQFQTNRASFHSLLTLGKLASQGRIP